MERNLKERINNVVYYNIPNIISGRLIFPLCLFYYRILFILKFWILSTNQERVSATYTMLKVPPTFSLLAAL